MQRFEFERLRDLSGKRIPEDIVLKRKKAGSPVFESGPVPIAMESGVLANLYVSFNEETESKTVNVMIVGVGPVCRLDVDGRVHRPAGRSHKHALRTPECPAENLARDLIDRPDLAGLSLERVFAEFCNMAHIEFSGSLRFSG
jgi:hypothetical protein